MKATIQYIETELEGLYPNTEIKGFSRIIFDAVCGWGFSEQVLKKHETISATDFKKIQEIVDRLKNFEPIQYILGETEFYELKLKVNPSVLIPRPETEELVEWVLRSNLPDNCNVLDVGTGSGCIALALKNKLRKANISGMDISDDALEIARINAVDNGLEVNFFLGDILNLYYSDLKKYDVIVSNPPYIREIEKSEMHANVLVYEPGNALFVSDSDPLKFYKAIASFAKRNLNKNGMLFFEINEHLGKEMMNLLNDFGFCDIKIRKDINGKDRMVYCRNGI